MAPWENLRRWLEEQVAMLTERWQQCRLTISSRAAEAWAGTLQNGDEATMTDRTGGCACGAIRFKITAPLMGVGACHCTDCQKASGGGPNYVALAPKSGFEITQGEARVYVTKGDSGEDAGRAFCPNCGTPLWSLPPKAPFATVRLGALDHNADLTPALHLYTASAPPWHLMREGVPTFPKMPPFPPPAA
jgi:hypothetical protein